MNKVILMGRLTRDPELRRANNGSDMAIVRYTLAVDRAMKKDDNASTDFIQCVAFGKAGEFAEKYFVKGLRVLVSGRLNTGSYTNKDGQKVYTTDVIVESQEFADGKRGEEGYSMGDNSRNFTDNANYDDFSRFSDDSVDDMEIPFGP